MERQYGRRKPGERFTRQDSEPKPDTLVDELDSDEDLVCVEGPLDRHVQQASDITDFRPDVTEIKKQESPSEIEETEPESELKPEPAPEVELEPPAEPALEPKPESPAEPMSDLTPGDVSAFIPSPVPDAPPEKELKDNEDEVKGLGGFMDLTDSKNMQEDEDAE